MLGSEAGRLNVILIELELFKVCLALPRGFEPFLSLSQVPRRLPHLCMVFAMKFEVECMS